MSWQSLQLLFENKLEGRKLYRKYWWSILWSVLHQDSAELAHGVLSHLWSPFWREIYDQQQVLQDRKPTPSLSCSEKQTVQHSCWFIFSEDLRTLNSSLTRSRWLPVDLLNRVRILIWREKTTTEWFRSSRSLRQTRDAEHSFPCASSFLTSKSLQPSPKPVHRLTMTAATSKPPDDMPAPHLQVVQKHWCEHFDLRKHSSSFHIFKTKLLHHCKAWLQRSQAWKG